MQQNTKRQSPITKLSSPNKQKKLKYILYEENNL